MLFGFNFKKKAGNNCTSPVAANMEVISSHRIADRIILDVLYFGKQKVIQLLAIFIFYLCRTI